MSVPSFDAVKTAPWLQIGDNQLELRGGLANQHNASEVATAISNGRVVPTDYPHIIDGNWSGGHGVGVVRSLSDEGNWVLSVKRQPDVAALRKAGFSITTLTTPSKPESRGGTSVPLPTAGPR
jgi:hypothetical protein